jgi:hypothetical protein
MWSLFNNKFLLFRRSGTLYTLIDSCTGAIIHDTLQLPQKVCMTSTEHYLYIYLSGIVFKVARVNMEKVTPENICDVIESIVTNKKVKVEDAVEEIELCAEVLADEHSNILFFNPYRMEIVGYIHYNRSDIETFIPIVNNFLSKMNAELAGTDAKCHVKFDNGNIIITINNEVSIFHVITPKNEMPVMPTMPEIPVGYTAIKTYRGLMGGALLCKNLGSTILMTKKETREVDPERFQCIHNDGIYFVIDNTDHCSEADCEQAAFSCKINQFTLLAYELGK